MRGTILGVHDGRGVLLSATDERRYEFPLTEWRSPGTPVAGQAVDFVGANGEARSVFAVPGVYGARPAGAVQPQSGSMVLSAIAVGCLLVGFIIPVLPTIAAYVLGVIGAGQAQREGDETALLLSRIAWIGALVLLAVGILAILAMFALLGTAFFAAAWHGLGPMDF
jgi:hypothetical protein